MSPVPDKSAKKSAEESVVGRVVIAESLMVSAVVVSAIALMV